MMWASQGSQRLCRLGSNTYEVAPSAGSYSHHSHPRGQTSSDSDSPYRKRDSPVFPVPQRVVPAASPHCYSLSPYHALYLHFLQDFTVNRNHCISKYHPFIMSGEHHVSRALIQKMCSLHLWNPVSVNDRENLFMLCCGKVEPFLPVGGR